MMSIRCAVMNLTLLVVILAVANPGWRMSVMAHESEAAAVSIDGDTVTRIATSTPDATVQIVAGGDGLYRRGAGQSWARIGDAPTAGAIVFAAGAPDLLLSGDHPPCLRGGEGTGLTRSEDGGVSWTAVAGATDIRPLAIWSDTGVAIGSSCGGFMLSTDTGLTWTAIAVHEPGFEITAFTVVAAPKETQGPVILFGETSEGGSSRLRMLDLADPAAPVISDGVHDYYGLAGLAGSGDTFAVAAIDGVWLSTDAGVTWTRRADGLEAVVLEDDPAEVGLPADVALDEIGVFSIAFLSGSVARLAVGSAVGLYVLSMLDGEWMPAGEITARVDQVLVSEGDNRLLLRSHDTVLEMTLDH